MPHEQDIRPVALNVSGKTLALITGGGFVLGALIVVGAIMPAEFNTDPLGIGKATGIGRLWAPEEKGFAGGGALATSSDTPKTSHIVDIPLGAADWKEAAIEYKVAMKPGQSIFYKWTATNLDGTPATIPVETDQHGHDLELVKYSERLHYSVASEHVQGEESSEAEVPAGGDVDLRVRTRFGCV